MNIWFFIGIGLVCWVVYDLYQGTTYSYRLIEKEKEPTLYWITWSIWAIIALGVLYSGFIQ